MTVADLCERLHARVESTSEPVEALDPDLAQAEEVWVSSALHWILPERPSIAPTHPLAEGEHGTWHRLPGDYVEIIDEYTRKPTGQQRIAWGEDYARPHEGRLVSYRRLGAHWYCWLHGRMHAARLAHRDGQLAQRHMDALEDRWRQIEAWLTQRHGRERLQRAVRRGIRLDYQPPQVESGYALLERLRGQR